MVISNPGQRTLENLAQMQIVTGTDVNSQPSYQLELIMSFIKIKRGDLTLDMSLRLKYNARKDEGGMGRSTEKESLY